MQNNIVFFTIIFIIFNFIFLGVAYFKKDKSNFSKIEFSKIIHFFILNFLFSILLTIIVGTFTTSLFENMYTKTLKKTINLEKISTLNETYYVKERNSIFYIEENINNVVQKLKPITRNEIKIRNNGDLYIQNTYTYDVLNQNNWFLKYILPFKKEVNEYIVSSKYIYYED